MEMRDIVDEYDRVIATVPRNEAREKNLARRGVRIVLRNREGRILIQRRGAKKRMHAGKWELPGGGVEAGETYEQAALRELHEECFYECPVPSIAFKERYVYRHPPGHRPGFSGVLFAQGDCPAVPNPHEVDELRWLPEEEFAKEIADHPEKFSSLTYAIFDIYIKRKTELLDCVDPDNIVRYQWPIGLAHEHPTIHRSTALLIFKDPGRKEMAIQQRSDNQHIAPGKWADTGGHIPHGKSPEDNIREEFAEEMFSGIRAPDVEFTHLFTLYKETDGDPEFKYVFETFYDGKFSAQEHEVKDWRWVSLEQLGREMADRPDTFTESFRLVIERWWDA